MSRKVRRAGAERPVSPGEAAASRMHRAADLVQELHDAGCAIEIGFHRSAECRGFVFQVSFPLNGLEWRSRIDPRIAELAHEMAILLGAEIRN